MNKLTILFVSLALSINISCAQPKNVSGVYAGIEIMPGVVMGGGMSRSDEVLLLRPDGTYNDNLGKSDWQTRVTGHYTVAGNQLSLRDSKTNKVSTSKFDKDGNISMGSYNLVKQPVDSRVPKGVFEFSVINSSGGGSSGTAYVGTGSDKSLYFDGNGNFNGSSASATAVIGGNIGGGSSKKSAGAGTYTISKGVLTLKYNDGRTQLHSFFCRPGYDPVMAVIDGNIYFMKDGKGGGKLNTSSSKKGSANTASQGSKTTSATENSANDGKALLLKANAAHGGTALNNIKTVSFSATLQGMQANSYIDLRGNRVRMEFRQGGKLVQVEQLEGESGWQWQSGKVSSLPANRAAEMRGAFYSGLLGLRQSQINAANIKSVKPANNGYTIVCEQNGKSYAYLLNDQGRMTGSADQSGQTANFSAYANFRSVSGVLIPFNEVLSSGKQKIAIQYKSFEINPAFTESIWAKP